MTPAPSCPLRNPGLRRDRLPRPLRVGPSALGNDWGPVCLGTSKAVRSTLERRQASASIAVMADHHCPNRSKARSWPRNRRDLANVRANDRERSAQRSGTPWSSQVKGL